jgi:hypothetical protein
MAGMRLQNIVILGCYLVIFVGLGVVIWWEYFSTQDSDPTGMKSKRVRLRAYVAMAIAWLIMAIVQSTKIVHWSR